MKKSSKKQWVSKNKIAEHYTLKDFKNVRPNIGVKKNNHIVNRKINHLLRTEPDDKFRHDEIKQWKKLLR